MSQQPKSGLGRFNFRFLDHTELDLHTHTHGRTSLNELSGHLSLSGLLRNLWIDNTQKTQETNIRTLSRIRTRDPWNQTVLYLMATGNGQLHVRSTVF